MNPSTHRGANFHLNAFYLGDNINVLRSFDSETVDLIATDPPFNKKREAFGGELKGGGKAKFKDNWHWVDPDPDKGKRHDPDAVENHPDWLESICNLHPKVYALITATRDVYGDDMAAFLCWLGVRILEMHRVLKPTGSMYIHIDHTAHAYVKVMMDAIFGRKNFRNEIVWRYDGPQGPSKGDFATKHDTILRYTRTANYDANTRGLYPVPEDELRQKYRLSEDGRWYYDLPRGNYTEESIARLEKEGRIRRTRTGNVRVMYYLHQASDGTVHREKAIPDVWSDIPSLGQSGQSKEKTDYPTQKPLALYKRMIEASSKPGDIVLDPFAGCATTAVAAQMLRRNWVAIDILAKGYDETKRRMSDERELDQQTIVIGPTITDLPARTDDGHTAAEPLNPKPRKQRPPSKIDKDRDCNLDILIAEFGLQCWGCGFTPPGEAGQLHGRDFFELDHIRPQSEHGTHDIRNRAILCGPCNRRKGGFGGTLTALRKDNKTAQRIYGEQLLEMAEVIDWHARYDPDEERLL